MRKQKQIDQLREMITQIQRDLYDHTGAAYGHLDLLDEVQRLERRVDKMDPPKPIPRFEIVKTEDGTWNLIEYADKHQKLIGVYDTKPEAKQRVSEILAFRKNPHKDNEVIVP